MGLCTTRLILLGHGARSLSSQIGGGESFGNNSLRAILLGFPSSWKIKSKNKNKTKGKNQNVDSSSCAAFLSFGDSAEKSLGLKSFQPIYGGQLFIN